MKTDYSRAELEAKRLRKGFIYPGEAHPGRNKRKNRRSHKYN
jgi:hypothetical protein